MIFKFWIADFRFLIKTCATECRYLCKKSSNLKIVNLKLFMQLYCESLTEYKRLPTREVKIGDLGPLPCGYPGHPIRVQTMTTTDTMDTMATVEKLIRCIEAGSELILIMAPSKREAENLLNIKNELRKRGYDTPILVADIHFRPPMRPK